MIDFEDFFAASADSPLAAFHPTLRDNLQNRFHDRPHGDMRRWQQILESLPELVPAHIRLDQDAVTIGSAAETDDRQQQRLTTSLQALMPWRKGPFSFFGIDIDSEWRSDLKWRRLLPHIDPLAGRRILDVGCGNGYYLWRMRGAGADLALGVDPTLLFLVQFRAARHFLPSQPVYLLPLRGEDLPNGMACFDTVFSMGVLYHRRDPLQHLTELRSALRQGGQLVLETLVIEGGPGDTLVPPGRYAQMRNVWQIPSVDTLKAWLTQLGFDTIRVIDVSVTTVSEQRQTAWMQFQSLSDFLEPGNPARTIEGLPAPCRVILSARL